MLTKLHLQEMKAEMVFDVSHGRTSSTLDLVDLEMDELIRHLNTIEKELNQQTEVHKSLDKERADKMRKKVLHYCHLMRWYKDGTTRLDWERINNFCLKFGSKHKKLNQYDIAELRTLITQFEKVYQHFLSKL